MYKTLQKEVDEFFAAEVTSSDFDTGSLGKLRYLQACIDESLRLFPPVMSGLQRQTPAQGIHIGERFIPGNTIVQTPTYTMCRGESSPGWTKATTGKVLTEAHKIPGPSRAVTSSSRSVGPRSPSSSGTLLSTCPSQSVSNPIPLMLLDKEVTCVLNPLGRFSCVGKQLGLMEVRRVTALIARKYDVAMAPGQTKEAFLGGLRDNFTLATPALNLVFSPRV